MTASFTLTLDTRAPSVTFGPPIGTTAGELLHVPYVADEPLDAAELRLVDGRHLALTIGVDELTVLLPPDTPDGAAAIWVSDDVGNAVTYSAAVVLSGVVVPTPDEPRPTPGVPSRPRPRSRARRRIATTSRVQSRARARVEARGAYLATAIATSRAAVAAGARGSSAAAAHSRARVSASASGGASATATSRAEVRRGDGPTAEAVILDLL